MTQEQLGELFAKYTRFNVEANRTTVGTGLGMSITKRLLSLMDGEIFVESEPGKGSVFTVRLPQKRVGDIVCGPTIAEHLNDYEFLSKSKAKRIRVLHEYMPYGSVLIVDDIASNIYVTRGMLLPYELKIDTASSGFEAVEKVKSGNVYDIIFMDHMMPKMDGIEATRIIRDMGYKGYIIALTANALAGQAEVFTKNSFDGFISKPIDSRELNNILNEFIRNKKPLEVVKEARLKRRSEIANMKPAEKSQHSEIEELFIEDAMGVIAVLQEISAKGDDFSDDDIISYEIAVHGIKSALLNIGEKELSDFAYVLERACAERNFEVIRYETPNLIYALSDIVERFSGTADSGE